MLLYFGLVSICSNVYLYNGGSFLRRSSGITKPVKRIQRGIYCEDCTYWYHIKCIDLPIDEYQSLSTSSESWYCANCILPIFSNSFFNTEDVEDKSNARFLLDGKSDLIKVSRPPPYWFLSLRCTLYPSTLNRLSLKDSSSFVCKLYLSYF
jgi:hypothetical protein